MILGYGQILNSNFNQGIVSWTLNAGWALPSTSAAALTFVASTKKITRTVGSFSGNGFMVGNIIKCATSSSNPGPFTITVVAATELTVSETVVDEAEATQVVTLHDEYRMINHYTNGTTTLTQTPTPAPVSGQLYYLSYQVLLVTAGNVTASCGGVSDTARTANGFYESYFTASSTAALVFTPSNTARLSIDNVQLQRVVGYRNPSITSIPSMPNITKILDPGGLMQ